MKQLFKNLFEHKLRLFSITTLLVVMLYSAFRFINSINLLTGIENGLRQTVVITVIVIAIGVIFASYNVILSKKKPRFISLLIFLILFNAVSLTISINVDKIYSKLSGLVNENKTYTSALIAKSDNEASSLDNLNDGTIGILKSEDVFEGHIIPKEIIETNKLKNEVKEYDNYLGMLEDLTNDKLDFAFVPGSYVTKFSNIEGFEKIQENTKVIYTQNKDVEKELVTHDIKKPFSILLMGVDSDQEGIENASYNGDSLILVTFNPNTLNTTMLSIPRDSYVPIMCFAGDKKNKITHAAWHGEECMIETIENFSGIDIDYYLKMNFKGVVDLVDALGGIDVDVPMDFCEQSSDRKGGYELCLKKGMQSLNGEEALALARHRKTINDFIRGENQQLVVKSLLAKMSTVRDIDTVYNLFDKLGNNMDTNMEVNTIINFYNIGKDILVKSQNSSVDDLLSIHKLKLTGYDRVLYDYNQYDASGTKLHLYNFVPYEGSIKDVSDAMKVNLNLKSSELIKTFTYNIDEKYEIQTIGTGPYNGPYLQRLKDLTGFTEGEARSYASQNGFKIIVKHEVYDKTVSGNTLNIEKGDVFYQDIAKGIDFEYLHTLTVKVASEVIIPEEVVEEPEDNVDSESTETSNQSETNAENEEINTEENTIEKDE